MWRDPIGYEGGVNVYGYVDKFILNRTDLMGQKPYPSWVDKETCRTINFGNSASLGLGVVGMVSIGITAEECDCCTNYNKVSSGYRRVEIVASGFVGIGASIEAKVMGVDVGGTVTLYRLDISQAYGLESGKCGEKPRTFRHTTDFGGTFGPSFSAGFLIGADLNINGSINGYYTIEHNFITSNGKISLGYEWTAGISGTYTIGFVTNPFISGKTKSAGGVLELVSW